MGLSQPTRSKHVFVAVLLAAAATVGSGVAGAAEYPAKNINWIVMWRAGGGADTASRMFTKQLEEVLDTNVVVQNITGGGGSMGYLTAKDAKPDGYTLVTIQGDLPKFEPMGLAPIAIDDFDVIAGFAFQAPVLVARADSPWENAADFVEAAKDNPGGYTIGVTDIGGVFHQPMALWQETADFEATPIVHPGSQEQTVAVLSGQDDLALTWVKAAAPYVEEGELKFLGYMASERMEGYPDVPTLRELGWDAVWEHPYGFGGPKGLPDEVKMTLLDAARQIWDIPEFQDDLERVGLSLLREDSEAYTQHMHKMQDDMEKALSLIQE